MKYDPVLPSHNDNINPEHPLKEFAILVMGLLSFLLAAYVVLGFFVDRAVATISPELERELFRHVPQAWAVGQSDKVDPRQQKTQQLVDALRSCLGISSPITVIVKESEAANAMALPGGTIVVLSGLFDKVESENGLAFVLGHELGHFTNRDHLRGLGRGLVLMVLAASVSGPDSSLTKMITPTVNLSQAHYSQERETEADSSGLLALHCYYGHVGGAVEFFESMAKEEENGIPLSHYFASHPAMVKRIAHLRREAAVNQWPARQPRPLIFPGEKDE